MYAIPEYFIGLVQIPPQMHQTVQPVYQYAGPAQALNSQAQASMAADSHLWSELIACAILMSICCLEWIQ